jgi:hypothetical protein
LIEGRSPPLKKGPACPVGRDEGGFCNFIYYVCISNKKYKMRKMWVFVLYMKKTKKMHFPAKAI